MQLCKRNSCPPEAVNFTRPIPSNCEPELVPSKGKTAAEVSLKIGIFGFWTRLLFVVP